MNYFIGLFFIVSVFGGTPQNKSCSQSDWYRCGGIITDCWKHCLENVNTNNCMSCCGDTWNICSKCYNEFSGLNIGKIMVIYTLQMGLHIRIHALREMIYLNVLKL